MYVHCSVKGEPVPALKWMLPGGIHVKPSQFLGRRLFVFPNGTLFVKSVLPSDGGRYEFTHLLDIDAYVSIVKICLNCFCVTIGLTKLPSILTGMSV